MRQVQVLNKKEFKLIELSYIIPNFLDKLQCKKLIKAFHLNKSTQIKEGYLDTNNKESKNSANVVKLNPFCSESKFLNSSVREILRQYKLYLEKFEMFHMAMWTNNFNYIHAYRLLQYQQNDFIDDHCDYDVGYVGSCVINLNDDYKGGEFIFFNGQYQISLGVGDAFIFPADVYWLHRTNPIIEGERYSFNCFIRDIPATYDGSPFDLKENNYDNYESISKITY